MADVQPPVVVDLGKKSRKKIKRLKRAQGPLANEVGAIVAETIAQMGDAAEGKTFVPVVMIYAKKAKKRPFPWMLWP